MTESSDSEIAVGVAAELLGVTRQALSGLPKGRRGYLLRTPVLTRYYSDRARLEGRLDRMGSEARRLGLADLPEPDGDPSQLTLSPESHQPVDRELSTGRDAPPERVGDRVDTALGETEIDRLKSEVRRANRTIDGLFLTIDTLRAVAENARPAENVGLDEVLPPSS